MLPYRDQLAQGKVKDAEVSVKELQQPGLGMFQYLADLTLIYASTPLFVRSDAQRQNPSNQGPVPPALDGDADKLTKKRAKDAIMALRGRLRGQPNVHLSNSDSMGRDQMLLNMASQFHTSIETGGRGLSIEGQPMSVSEGFGSILHADGILDLRNGVAHSFFVEELPLDSMSTHSERLAEAKNRKDKSSDTNPTASEGEIEVDVEVEVEQDNLRVHHRQWFTSEVDDVLVGTMDCADVSRSKASSSDNQSNSITPTASIGLTSCLNVAVRLSRDSGPNDPPPTIFQIVKMKDGIAFGRDVDKKRGNADANADAAEGGKGLGMIKSDSFAFQGSVKSGNGMTLPSTVTCGVIRCNSIRVKEETGDSGSNSSIGGSLVHLQLTGTLQGDGSESALGMPAVTCNSAASADIIISITNPSKNLPI
jgi:hypothetical protein